MCMNCANEGDDALAARLRKMHQSAELEAAAKTAAKEDEDEDWHEEVETADKESVEEVIDSRAKDVEATVVDEKAKEAMRETTEHKKEAREPERLGWSLGKGANNPFPYEEGPVAVEPGGGESLEEVEKSGSKDSGALLEASREFQCKERHADTSTGAQKEPSSQKPTSKTLIVRLCSTQSTKIHGLSVENHDVPARRRSSGG